MCSTEMFMIYKSISIKSLSCKLQTKANVFEVYLIVVSVIRIIFCQCCDCQVSEQMSFKKELDATKATLSQTDQERDTLKQENNNLKKELADARCDTGKLLHV